MAQIHTKTIYWVDLRGYPISPKIFPSLVNLEHLMICNVCFMEEWQKYLSIASFPNLQYLKPSYLSCVEHQLVEKSHGNILKINTVYGNIIEILYILKNYSRQLLEIVQRLKN